MRRGPRCAQIPRKDACVLAPTVDSHAHIRLTGSLVGHLLYPYLMTDSFSPDQGLSLNLKILGSVLRSHGLIPAGSKLNYSKGFQFLIFPAIGRSFPTLRNEGYAAWCVAPARQTDHTCELPVPSPPKNLRELVAITVQHFQMPVLFKLN